MDAPGTDLFGMGGSVALSFVSLALVCFVAYFVLRWLGRKGIGRSDDCVKVLGRCFLEPRRSVYVIEVAGRCFVIGVGDGPVSLLAEVEKSSLPPIAMGPRSSNGPFNDVLAKVLRRQGR